MNTGGTEGSHGEGGGAGMERFTALMSDGGRSGKLDLLLHLLANLPRPLLLLGPSGAGKTSLFRQVQSRALENWTTCYLSASATLSLDWVYQQMLQVLHQGPRPGPEPAPEAHLEAELALLSKRNGRLILLLDDAGQLLPGLLGAICQFTRLHPEIRLAFALRPEDLAQKAAGDPLALADAHVIELSPLRRGHATPAQSGGPQPRESGLGKAFLTVLRPRRGLGSKIAGPVVVALLGAATVAGFVVQALWHAEPPLPVASPEATPPPAVNAVQPIPDAVPEPSASPSPSAVAQALMTEDQPTPAGSPQTDADASPTPGAEPSPTPSTSPAAAPADVETPPSGPAPAATSPIPEKPFVELLGTVPTSRAPAYARLLELWGVAPQKPVGDECAYAKTRALRCQNVRADWQSLQALNRPAVLELAQGGVRRYLTLIGLDGDKAVVDLNGQAVKTPLAEIQPYLRGEAVILWKPPFDKASIGTRERHETARWIRERLGVPAAPGQETVFDEQLKAKVIAFQKQKGLLADGRAGALTLLQIQLLEDDPQAPKLTAPLSEPAASGP